MPHANKVLNDMQLMRHEINDLQDFHQGKVRIATPQQLSAFSIPRLIRLFKEAYPDIQVTLIDCSIEEVASHVQMLDADIGLGPDLLHSNDLIQTKLFRSSFGLVVRVDHPLADSKVLTWQDLSEGDLITVQAPFADHIREKLTLDICTRLFRSDYQVNFLSTALGMVKEGLGITMTLGYAKTWVDEQGLVMIPIHEPQIGYEFLLYKHRQRSQRPAMKSFENFLVKAAKDWLLHI